MTFNMPDSKHPEGVVATIRSSGADVVALQELNPPAAARIQRDPATAYPIKRSIRTKVIVAWASSAATHCNSTCGAREAGLGHGTESPITARRWSASPSNLTRLRRAVYHHGVLSLDHVWFFT
jgi:hypothetical protein